jgi:hypothetical protein
MIVGAAVAAAYWYAYFVNLQNNVRSARSGMMGSLSPLHGLVPELLLIGKRHLEFEEQLMQDLVRLRAAAQEQQGGGDLASLRKTVGAQLQLQQAVNHFLTLAENRREAASDPAVARARMVYDDTARAFTDARHRYNTAVLTFNTVLEGLPGAVVADWMKIPPFPYLNI